MSYEERRRSKVTSTTAAAMGGHKSHGTAAMAAAEVLRERVLLICTIPDLGYKRDHFSWILQYTTQRKQLYFFKTFLYSLL